MSRAATEPIPVGFKLASHFTSVPDLLRLAGRAEALGYNSVWTTEGRMSPDAVTVTSAMAALTKRIRIGTSVLNPFTRTPGLLAVTAAAIDQISEGRFILGIGAGDPSTLEKQSIAYDRPLTRLREYVTVVRELWAGKTVQFVGDTIRITDLQMDFRPYRGDLPVYVGATGPRALRLAGEIGDAVLLTICVPRSYVSRVLASTDRQHGAKVVAHVAIVMAADAGDALRAAKPLIVNYLIRFPSIAKASGVPAELVTALRKASADGIDKALAILPDHYVTELAAVGTPEDCRRWIREYSAGADEVLVMPAYGDPDLIVEELAPDRMWSLPS
jgi:5,10-methylenetetrahydromethanopterin reductase